MTQETISRAELDADQARQETTFTAQVYQLAAGLQDEMHQCGPACRPMHHADRPVAGRDAPDAGRPTGRDAPPGHLRAEIHQLERRMFLVAAMATGLIIGAMQLD